MTEREKELVLAYIMFDGWESLRHTQEAEGSETL